MKRLVLCPLFLFSLIQSAAAAGQDDVAAFRERVQPFVEAHCIDSHGPDVQKAGLRLDVLGSDLTDEASFAKWVRVYDKITAGKMPPPDSDSLAKQDAESFAKWIHEELHAASLAWQQSQGHALEVRWTVLVCTPFPIVAWRAAVTCSAVRRSS